MLQWITISHHFLAHACGNHRKQARSGHECSQRTTLSDQCCQHLIPPESWQSTAKLTWAIWKLERIVPAQKMLIVDVCNSIYTASHQGIHARSPFQDMAADGATAHLQLCPMQVQAAAATHSTPLARTGPQPALQWMSGRRGGSGGAALPGRARGASSLSARSRRAAVCCGAE